MNNIDINKGSNLSDIIQAIAGEWSNDKINDWDILRMGKFEIWKTVVNEAGNKLLPFKVKSTEVIKIYYEDNTFESVIINVNSTNVYAAKPAVMECIIIK
jgi:hypothetical protein